METNPLRVEQFEIAEDVWAQIALLLPPPRRKIKKGRPRLPDRQAMTAILYKLHTDCSWKDLPPGMGAGSTIYDRFQEWQSAGVFEKLRIAGIFPTHQEASSL